jgi:glycosyltransferase involved in cell wall biosynthesis
MTKLTLAPPHGGIPSLSIVMPCYNEEAILGYTVPKLVEAFRKGGFHLQLVAVDNGSHDRTSEILQSLAARYTEVLPHHVVVNEGYGNGILQGIPRCTASWIGMIPADGQVDAEDVVRLFEAALAAGTPVLAKVRRRFRMDGLSRKILSALYNLFVRMLWPKLGSIDVNGTPKILPREAILAMNLRSKDWFLDPEIMVKAHYMGIRVLEFNAFGRLRGAGLSHVKATTCWEFFRNLLVFRFSNQWLVGFQQHDSGKNSSMSVRKTEGY